MRFERPLTKAEEAALKKRLKRRVLKQPDTGRLCRCGRPAKVYMAQVPAGQASQALREGRVEPEEGARLMEEAKAYCASCYVAAIFRRA